MRLGGFYEIKKQNNGRLVHGFGDGFFAAPFFR